MGVRHRLLDTPPERVPPALAREVVAFCTSVEAVTAGYVGLTEVTADQEPYEQLAAAFELDAEDDAHLQAFADRFYASAPPDLQAGGCNVLDAGGAAAWRAHALRVFER